MTTMGADAARPALPARRLLIVRILLGLATLGAIGAALTQVPVVFDAGGATKVVETWRLYGFVVFAGLFALLLLRPTGNLTVWLLAIGDKVALTLTAFGYQAHGGIAGTGTIITFDGGLAVVLIAAFVLSRVRSASVADRGAAPSRGHS
jgi:hypothetical protein